MTRNWPRLCLASFGLLSGACVAFGYDFGEYQAAGGAAGSSGEAHTTRIHDPSVAEGGGHLDSPDGPTSAEGGAGGAGAGNANSHAGAADDGSTLTTFAAGGAPVAEVPEPPTSCGGAAPTAGAGGEAGATGCAPVDCEAPVQCGAVDDGCGRSTDCGPCFWWFEQCHENRCVILINPYE
jgi:hypothetical protein